MESLQIKNTKNNLLKTAVNRVPQVTLAFWIVKLMAVTVGETGADFIIENVGLGLANTSLIMSIIMAGVLFLQFKQKRYVPWIYWLAVVMVSVVGTLITDYLVDDLRVSLITVSLVFSAALASTFWLWYKKEGTLSIHTIFTTRREAFYWLAILFTFALGTGAGDLAAESLNLGYLTATIAYAALVGGIAILFFTKKMGGILAFWLAYIFTRPMGASLGDFVSKPISEGGAGLGTTSTSFVFLGVILLTVIYMTKTHVGAENDN